MYNLGTLEKPNTHDGFHLSGRIGTYNNCILAKSLLSQKKSVKSNKMRMTSIVSFYMLLV